MRFDGRAESELRKVEITPGFLKFAQGSCLLEVGDTKVICTASVEDRVPPFLKNQGTGWITAEYSMLPGATPVRSFREVSRGRPGGRTVEIQRLIGRSLRAAMDLRALGEKTVWIDCDVIQADGGTRTASITGGFVALVLALNNIKEAQGWSLLPVSDYVAAVSVGILNETVLLDLPYAEDSTADVDMNVVMTGSGEFVEVQGTGEHSTFDRQSLNALLDLAHKGIQELMGYQKDALGPIASLIKETRDKEGQ